MSRKKEVSTFGSRFPFLFGHESIPQIRWPNTVNNFYSNIWRRVWRMSKIASSFWTRLSSCLLQISSRKEKKNQKISLWCCSFLNGSQENEDKNDPRFFSSRILERNKSDQEERKLSEHYRIFWDSVKLKRRRMTRKWFKVSLDQDLRKSGVRNQESNRPSKKSRKFMWRVIPRGSSSLETTIWFKQQRLLWKGRFLFLGKQLRNNRFL
jgi:hypothetical protein